MKGRMSLYICKCEYLKEHGFEGHIKRVSYWYRKVFNAHRGKSATARLQEYRSSNTTVDHRPTGKG